MALYGVAQEALGNAAKHSKAKEVHVRLMRADGMVRLTVSDDGVGFVPRSAGDSGGVGLVNMRERVRYLNGTLVLEGEPDHDTTIRAEVPFLNPSNPTARQQ
ncbi:MAG TPA: ATP-binding protein [Myxococcales bacterium]